MFISINPEEKNTSLLASQSTIRTIYQILGLSGIAFIDILAADEFVNTCTNLAEMIKNKKIFEEIQGFAKAAFDDSEFQFKYKWVEHFAKKDSLNDPLFEKFIKIFGKLGAIARFRKLIRTCIDVPSSETNFQFLSKKIRPETDEILNMRLEGHPIVSLASNKFFCPFIGSLLSSLSFTKVEYNCQHNTFTNNINLVTMGAESILGFNMFKNPQENPIIPLQEIINTGYFAIPAGVKNLEQVNKKLKFPALQLRLAFDHFIQNSYYLNYGNLEKLIPYQTIRHIYTFVFTEWSTPKQKGK